MKKYFVLVLLLIFIITVNIISCKTFKNKKNAGMETTAVITGSIVIFGNEPFSYAGIVDINGTAYNIIPRSTADELSRLQGHIIEFTVIFPDEQIQGYGSLPGGTVTPISWKIIQ
ncbi:MAG: hypothetical protein FWD47_08945 [Treponema sp.]|nr:hypothetical protein [Treponema sp.]